MSSSPSAAKPTHRRPSGRKLAALILGALAALVLLALLPVASAVGMFGPRTYLILGQDPAELQPYGGFVGVYGEVVMRWGRVEEVTSGDTRALDDTYQERLDNDEIESPPDDPPHLYAASDSPDYTEAAQAAREAYLQITGVHADGVIAIDPVAAAGLIRLVGPLEVEGEEQAITDSNLLPLVLKHTQQFDDNDADRKQFVYDLGSELKSRLTDLPVSRWGEVLGALAAAADERHLQIELGDPILRRLVAWRGWDGAFPAPTDDFLAVVDANVGYNKANLVTDSALDYRVAIGADGNVSATLTVNYENRGTRNLDFSTEDMPYVHDAPYEARLRVYAPRGAELRDWGNGGEPTTALDREVFQRWFTVEPESRATETFQYHLPDRAIDSGRIHYTLFVRKQAGTGAVPLTLRVSGPQGWRASGAQGNEWTARTTLDVDRQFSVTFERA